MKSMGTKKELPPGQREELLRTLKARFEKNMNRHKGLAWAKVQAKLEANAGKLWSLREALIKSAFRKSGLVLTVGITFD